jgi:hypothetical protein
VNEGMANGAKAIVEFSVVDGRVKIDVALEGQWTPLMADRVPDAIIAEMHRAEIARRLAAADAQRNPQVKEKEDV